MGSITTTRMISRGFLLLFLFSSSTANVIDVLFPGVNFTEKSCNDDGACFRKNTLIVASTTEHVSGLKFYEPRLVNVDTEDLIRHCAPSVEVKQFADSLKKCQKMKSMEYTCEFKEKGWLNSNSEPDDKAINNIFAGLSGAKDVIYNCNNLYEEYELKEDENESDDYNQLEKDIKDYYDIYKEAEDDYNQLEKEIKADHDDDDLLSELSLSVMPSKATLYKLTCLKNDMKKLIEKLIIEEGKKFFANAK